MTEEQKEYWICRKRGHVARDKEPDDSVHFDICKWCGSSFRFDVRQCEIKTPYGIPGSDEYKETLK